ncbi:hypothetical protein UYK15_003152 [Enterobacter asburiae]|nr:hypothetical protein [Enterobacter asburiae]
MQKVGDITSTATPEGEFTDGNVAGGVNPTLLMALWFNTIQRELCNVVTGSGGALDPNDFTQILEAIRRVAQGAIPTGLVKSVNTKTPDANGNISLAAGDITGSVTSVNTKTGAVVLSASDVSAISSLGGTYNVLLKLARVETVPTENNVSALYNVQGAVGSLVSGVEFNWYGNKFNIGITRDAGTGTNGLVIQHNGYTRFTIDKNGNLISAGEVSSSGKIVSGAGLYDTPGVRVYSPNNQPPQPDLSSYATSNWVMSNFVMNVRLGSESAASTGQHPSGYVLSAFDSVSGGVTGLYKRPLQVLINNAWLTVGSV